MDDNNTERFCFCKIIVDLTLGTVVLILSIIISPILLIIALFLIILRCLVIILAFVLLTDNGGTTLSGLDMLFVTNEFYNKPHSAIPGVVILEGQPDMDKIWKHWTNVLQKRSPDGKTLIYDRMLQYPYWWLGYSFWKWDKSFKVQNHIKLLENISLTQENLALYISSIARNPFSPNRPLWDVLIIPNYDGNQQRFVAVIRLHHCMSDGLSAVKLLLLGSMGLRTLPVDLIPQRMKISSWKKLLFYTKLVVAAPYICLKEMISMKDQNMIQNNKIKSGEWHFSFLSKLELQELKKAKNDLKNSFSAIVFTALSGAFEKFFQITYGSQNVPEKIHALGSFHYPNHPNDRLTNNWTILVYELRLKFSTLAMRLKGMKQMFQKATMSTFPFVSYFGFIAVGFLPKPFIELVTKFKNCTLILTNVPGPQFPCTLFDYPIVDILIWIPLIREVNGIGIAVISYNGSVRISITAENKCIGNLENIDILRNLIYEEFMNIIDESKLVVNVSTDV